MKSDRLKKAVRESSILSAVRALIQYVSDSFDKSLTGSLIAPVTDSTSMFGNSFSGNLFAGQSRRNSTIKKILRFIASGYEKSALSKICGKGYALFLNMRLRSIGFFLLMYSLFSVFALLILYSAGVTVADGDLFAVIAVGVFAVPLACSKRSLISSMSDARVIGSIIRESFGIDTEKKAEDVKGVTPPRKLSGFSLIFGIVAGTMTVFISPTYFVLSVLALLMFLFIMAIPEVGVISLIATVPLSLAVDSGEIFSFVLIFATLAGYLGKLVRGKRMFSIGFLDIAVFALFVLMFSSCFGNASSYYGASRFVIYMVVYFLFVNIIRHRTWLKRAARALVFSWIFTAFIGVLIPIIENTPYVSDALSFIGIVNTDRLFVFGVPSSSIYLLLPAIPFVLAVAHDTKDKRVRYLMYVFCTLIFVCIIMGGNSMPFVPLCMGLAIYVLCISPQLIFAAFPMWLVGFALQGVRVPFVSDAIAASASYAQSVIFENKYVRGGVVRALGEYIFTGIGTGDETFSKVYANFSYAGFEGASHPGGSFFGFLLGAGIIVTLIFVWVVLIFVRESGGFLRHTKDTSDNDRRYVAAALSGVSMLCVSSFADNVFSNGIMYLYLWVMIALGISFVRMRRIENERYFIRHEDTPERADAEMIYVSVSGK